MTFIPTRSQKICTVLGWSPATLQPCFGIVNANQRFIVKDASLTHTHLLQARKPVILEADHWKQKLQPELCFNHEQWEALYPPPINNKHGDLSWKITHRVIPTAFSLIGTDAVLRTL